MTTSLLIALIPALIFPACLVWAAISDITTMTIPNRATLGLAAAFVPAALIIGLLVPECRLTLGGWGIHLGIGVATLAFVMGLFAFNLIGGGDAKLLAATSLWLGLHGLVALLVYTALFGGLLALGVLIMRKFFWHYGQGLPRWLGQHLEEKGGIPYGLAICGGGIAVFVQPEYNDFLGPLVRHFLP